MVCRFLTVALMLIGALPAAAQGLRVEARVVQQVDRPAADAPVLSSSVTLLYSGRAWDYVDSADEIILFEPAARRFVVLNTARELRTIVSFEEIRHLLNARRKESTRYVNDLRRVSGPEADRVSRMLSFQLNPQFDVHFDEGSGQMTLRAPGWTYSVRTHLWKDAEQVDEYLLYADWASRLNYVLHPASFFPEPRVELNRHLRERGRLPTVVELDLRPDERLRLRAEYKFVLHLSEADQKLIRSWESLAQSSSLKDMPFLRYQQTVLVSRR